MRCERCVAEGKQSAIFHDGASTTLMGDTRYYDEKGRYHIHDANTTTTRYHCSEGHVTHVKAKKECPVCDL